MLQNTQQLHQFNIIQANSTHVKVVAPLFDSYRQFYGQALNLKQAEDFLLERLTKQDSVIFLAVAQNDNTLDYLGFAQLYRSFSSVSMQLIWILNDLFVKPTSRNQGIGTALLDAAKACAVATKAKRLTLATATNNYPAQRLYEKSGYTKDEAFAHYQLNLL